MVRIMKIYRSNVYFLLLGLVIGSLLSGITVYAVTISSSNVLYDNTNSGIQSTNVEDAIDELYKDASGKLALNTFGDPSYAENYGNLQPRNNQITLNKGKYLIIESIGHSSFYSNNVSVVRLNETNITCADCVVQKLSGKYYEIHAQNKYSGVNGYLTTECNTYLYYVDVLNDNVTISHSFGWGNYAHFPAYLYLQAIPINE